jgi:acyl dehydratase
MFDTTLPGLVHYEDIETGKPLTFGTWKVTPEDIKAFARRWDPQLIHLDEEAAKASIVGGLCASGFHTCCIMMRLLVDHFLLRTASLGAPGLDEVKWLKPVRPGDVLSIRIAAASKRVMASRPEVGLVLASYDVLNQTGDVVLAATCNQMIRVRAPGPRSLPSAPRESRPALINLWDFPAAERGMAQSRYFEDRIVGETWDVGGQSFSISTKPRRRRRSSADWRRAAGIRAATMCGCWSPIASNRRRRCVRRASQSPSMGPRRDSETCAGSNL